MGVASDLPEGNHNVANSTDDETTLVSLSDFVAALELVGLGDLLGSPGAYTCVANSATEGVQYAIVPGTFTARELKTLFKYATCEVASDTQDLPLAA